MERISNKLVSDNIPNIIKENGEVPITRILTDEEYKKELEKKLDEELQEVLEATGKDRIEELADILKTEKKQIVEAMLSTNSIASFQETVGQDDDMTLIDTVSLDEDIVEKYQHHLDLQKALNCLDAREKLIIDERYFQGLSQCEIAGELMISQAQVSRIEKKALEKLHKKLE